MQLRKILIFILIALGSLACRSEDIEPTELNGLSFAIASGRVLYPFGRYQLISYENNANITFKVNLEIKNEKDADGHFIINGQSNVNFYFAKFEADFAKQTVQIYGVASTRIGGTARELQFERDYLERLSKVTSYQFSQDGSKLILQIPQGNKKIIFDVNKD